ncbi:hypothetical protein CK203_029994 [Vitis vinifera]|uniref:Uncharacterized protein n=1 Tax=Vitis vinifera TaxID=29760 RepID=A0A438IK14_VITVI|nr:hypothetical protein CK203_029994 [Vitis vinifera]
MWFEACSGLKINLEKSKLIPVGKVHDIEGLAMELGCKMGGLPSCYLGLPLGAPFKSMAVWDGVEERFRRRLAMWKRQYISKGRRLTLIQNTLSSMPLYFMSLFYLPRKVRLRLEKIQRDFLWSGGALVQSHTLSEAFWRQVISHKYGEEEGGWRTWKRVRFWTNKWCGDEPLCESFSSLFSVSLSENAWVSEIQAFRVQREEEDREIWIASNGGAFSIKSLYSILELGGSSMFPSESIWRVRVPPKVAFFA